MLGEIAQQQDRRQVVIDRHQHQRDVGPGSARRRAGSEARAARSRPRTRSRTARGMSSVIFPGQKRLNSLHIDGRSGQRRQRPGLCYHRTAARPRQEKPSRAQEHRPRRRRPQHPHLRVDAAGSRGLPDQDLRRRRLGAGGAQPDAARPRHLRHQDAAHGRHGAPEPHPQDAAVPGDLPHLQGRGDRRGARPAHGRRRFHPQAVLPAPAARAHPRRAAPRRHRRRQGRRARPSASCAAS